jgi:cyclophilin family peptidyl-prolyl cis-trans isomerase
VVFGEITEGLDVAQSILALSGDDGQTPSREVTLETVEITES